MTSFPATILENPRQQYRFFYRAVVAAYGAACTTVHQHGLLGYIVSDAQWAQLPGNSVPNANPDLPNEILPRPNVTIPATPPAAASALTIKVWERRLADNVLVTDNLRTLKAQLLASVQPADLVILHDPFFGLLNVTASTILTHLTVLHGTLDRSDFAHLRAQLSNTMTPSESLQDFIGVHQLLHDQFAEAQQPLSELDKCHYFREAVKTLPHIHHAIESYLVTHPLVGNQIYRDLTTHVLQQAPNFAPTAASMGYAATTIVPTDVPIGHTSVTELLHSPAFAAIITAAVQKAAAPRYKNPPNRPVVAKKSATDAPKDRVYSYHHGYDSHCGVDCRHMRSNSFSSDKLAANTHMDVTGASTHRI